MPVTFNDKANRELIKRLELALQMGIENQVDYDAVDAAVDVWQTVKIDQIMLLGDYAKNAGKTVKAVESGLNVVYLMQDFLNHIHKSPLENIERIALNIYNVDVGAICFYMV